MVVFFLMGGNSIGIIGVTCLFQSPGLHPRTIESESLEWGSELSEFHGVQGDFYTG